MAYIKKIWKDYPDATTPTKAFVVAIEGDKSKVDILYKKISYLNQKYKI